MATLTAQEKGLKVLQAVYGGASKTYRDAVGEPTATMNLTEYAKPIIAEAEEYEPIQNEFVKTLINRIVATIIEDKLYNNNLAVLKKGYLAPLGTDIQHIYTNPINPRQYDGDNLAGILTKYDNDTKVAYYRRNREEVYPLSVNREQLAGAFVSWEKFNSFVSNLVNAVYSGAEIREYNVFKQAIVNAVADNRIQLRSMDYPTESTAKALVAEIKNVSSQMSFASSNFNKYAEIVKAETGEDVKPVVTWTPKDRQVIIMRSDVLNALSVEVLASAFNMTEAEFRYNLIEVDSFGFDTYNLETGEVSGHTDSSIGFMIADISLFQIYDNLRRTTSDFLGYSLTWQFFLHLWQTIAICPFGNAVAYSFTQEGQNKLTALYADHTTISLDDDVTEDTINLSIFPTNVEELSLRAVPTQYFEDSRIVDIPDVLPFDISIGELSNTVVPVTLSINDNFEFEAGKEYIVIFDVKQEDFDYPNVLIAVSYTKPE